MELCNYYSLDECLDRKTLKNKLTSIKNEGKIDYCIESDILKLEDLYLDDNEIIELIKFFDDNDVYPYPDYEDNSYYMDYDDDDDDDDF